MQTRSHARSIARAWLKHAHSFDRREPLARSNSGSPRFTYFPSLCACSESSLTNLIGSGLDPLCLQSHLKPECRWTWPGAPIFPAHVKRDPRGRGNLVPRVLSLLRESTLVTAGHVSKHANPSRTEDGPSTLLSREVNVALLYGRYLKRKQVICQRSCLVSCFGST